MNFLIKIFFVIILIFPISNSFGAMVTFIQNSEVNSESVLPGGPATGDLGGQYPHPLVKQLQGNRVSAQ